MTRLEREATGDGFSFPIRLILRTAITPRAFFEIAELKFPGTKATSSNARLGLPRQVTEADHDMDLHNLLRSWRGRQNASLAASEQAAGASADSIRADELVRIGASQRQNAHYQEALRSLTRAIELKHDCGRGAP